MIYHLFANLDNYNSAMNNGFVDRVEDGSWVQGYITDDNNNIVGHHTSSTLQWLEDDLKRKVEFSKDNVFIKHF